MRVNNEDREAVIPLQLFPGSQNRAAAETGLTFGRHRFALVNILPRLALLLAWSELFHPAAAK